jgi:hypothetical protein
MARKAKSRYRAMRDAGLLPQPERLVATTPALADCPHRGGEIRREQCPSCSGTVMVKVQACELHGECTLSSKVLPGVRKCEGCADRSRLG